MPSIAIVTVLYNSATVLPKFLSSLAAQTSRDWTLFAIDNASADGSADIVENWTGGNREVIRSADNKGLAAGSNQGIARV
jgi:GT2 family glycosyltransferase